MLVTCWLHTFVVVLLPGCFLILALKHFNLHAQTVGVALVGIFVNDVPVFLAHKLLDGSSVDVLLVMSFDEAKAQAAFERRAIS